MMPLRLAVAGLLLLLGAGGCHCGSGGGGGPPDPGVEPLPRYFPVARGDRWRLRIDPGNGRDTVAVTGIDARGVAVLFGARHGFAERYRVTEESVELVAEDGTTLHVILRAPLRRGAEWTYDVEEKDVGIRCHAEVAATGVDQEVAGTTVGECIRVRRSCTYPAGEPFPVETDRLTDEHYCPGIGRVRMSTTFQPTPSKNLFPAERRERVLFMRVAGAPSTGAPERFRCDHFLLHPSDVQAACGAGVRPVEAVDRGGRCLLRFESEGGPIEISAGRPPARPVAEIDAWLREGAAPDAEIADHASGVRVLRGQPRFALWSEGTDLRVSAAPEACSAAQVLRLVPLLTSLVDY